MVTKRLAPWFLVVVLLGVLSLVAACSGGGSTTTTKPTTTKPAVTTTTAKPTTTAPTTTNPATTTTASGGPPKAPNAIHSALWNNSPSTCLTCHVIGGAGVGVPGGTGIGTDHQGRTNDQCKGCHQLGS